MFRREVLAAPEWVLVVDDDAAIREMLAALLEAEGFAVEAAATGEEALMKRRDYAVVVLDSELPGVSGIDVARRLRRDHCAAGLVLYSGHVTPEVRAASEALGVPAVDKTQLERLIATCHSFAAARRARPWWRGRLRAAS